MSARHTHAKFPVRRPHFDFSAVPAEWIRGDLLSSTFFMSLLASFPDGEQFFIRSVRAHRDRAESAQERADIAAFIGQEAMHGHQHTALNEHLAAQGFDMPALLGHVRALLDAGDTNLSASDRLVVTAALEHLTAVLAKNYLANPAHRKRFQAATVAELLEWHALEESEHKAVAYDLLRTLNVPYIRRAALMLSTSAALAGYLAWATPHLYTSKTGRRPRLRDYAKLADTLFGRDGFVRQMVPDYLRWFKPSFHPDQQDTSALERAARESLALRAA